MQHHRVPGLRRAAGRVAIAAVIMFSFMLRPATAADPQDIVLYASEARTTSGHWAPATSSGAAGGQSMRSADHGWSSVDAPLASPSHYFEMTFDAPANTPYRLWLRLRAGSNSKWNDSVWVQFSDALVDGRAVYRTGTTSGLLVNLERCSGCGHSGWGWHNTAYWLQQPTVVSFGTSGTHTIRIQTREDGVEIDQIVLSPGTYLSSAPGPMINDTTILPKSGGSGTAAAYGGTPARIPGTIEAVRFDTGGAGVSYADTTPGNTGGAFRQGDVDIEPSSAGGYNVGWIAAGEWLNYTVTVDAAGTYNAELRVASIGGGALTLAFGAPSNASASVTVPNTGAWQAWTTVTVPVRLAAGQQVMTLKFTSSNFNLHSVKLTSTGGSAPADQPSSSGRTITVPAGGNLQAALDAAAPGDTILLEAGATFTGNFVLPAKDPAATAYITVRSSAPDSSLPASGVRMTPDYASRLPKLRSPNSVAALSTAPGAHHYRLQFLEFLPNANAAGTALALGDASSRQSTLDAVPHHLIVDRVYIHGDPSRGLRRGIALNSASTSVINSYVADIKSAEYDSQAICGWNGPGPFTIENNYLEASGENILFGGGDPTIPNLVPSDITIRRNHLSKPLSWRGSQWVVKNLLEFKNGQRVVIDGNLLENNWAAAQTGYAVLLKSENQDGTAPWTVVQQIEFTNNIVRNVAAGVSIAHVTRTQSIETNRITIRNNFFYNVSRASYGGSGQFLLIAAGSDITVDHNTVFNDGTTALMADGVVENMVFTNNLLLDNAWAIKGSGTAEGTDTIRHYFPGGDFRGGIYVGADPRMYPAGNYFPATLDDVGFVNASGGDYRLSSSSIYRGGGTDGKDPGCDFAALEAARR
jgi:hypothetical protein